MEPLYSFILIDDEPISNQLSEIQIKRVFENSTIAAHIDAKGALKAIERDYASFAEGTIIFLDINMPFSGWDFLKALNAMPTEVTSRFKVYMLSALANEDDMTKAESYPIVVGQLEKPLTKDLLLGIANK